jgi:DNA-binding XRE family transcriptional regulator
MTKTFKELRVQAGYKTVKEATKPLNISRSMLNKIEQGDRIPGRELIKRMSLEYKCSIEDIYSAIEATQCDIKKAV